MAQFSQTNYMEVETDDTKLQKHYVIGLRLQVNKWKGGSGRSDNNEETGTGK